MAVVKFDMCCRLWCVVGGCEVRGMKLNRIWGLVARHYRGRGGAISLQRFTRHSVELGQSIVVGICCVVASLKCKVTVEVMF